jgi:multidrug resistance efflux pump
MVAGNCFLVMVLALSGPPGAAPARSGTVVLDNCLISAFKEVEVPAAEAGVLVELNDNSREGTLVSEGDVLGKIDSADAIAKEKSALYEIASAIALSESDAEVESARSTVGVAKAEWDAGKAANAKSPGSVTQNELRRLELTYIRSSYELKVKILERENHGRTAGVKQAQLDGVRNEMKRRTITAPQSGMIVERLQHKGEWVQPGETVLKIVGFDQVRVMGFVPANKYSPTSILGSKVAVSVDVPSDDGQIISQTAQGVITFVSPIVETSGDFRVWAEINNRQDEAGLWIFRPGTVGKMEIQLNSRANTAAIPRETPK